MTDPEQPDEPQVEGKFEPARIKSTEELKDGPDAGADPAKGCDWNNRHYKNDDVRRIGNGRQARCNNGVWVEESILDPADPWQ